MEEPKSKKYKDLLIYHLMRMDLYMQEQTNGQLGLPSGGLNLAQAVESVDVDQYHEALDWSLDHMERFGVIRSPSNDS